MSDERTWTFLQPVKIMERMLYVANEPHAEELHLLVEDGIVRAATSEDIAATISVIDTKTVMDAMGGERMWWCEYPEFNDPECMTGMDNPRPQEARMPWKHSDCGWVWIVREAGDD